MGPLLGVAANHLDHGDEPDAHSGELNYIAGFVAVVYWLAQLAND